jgi:hypothetical protein
MFEVNSDNFIERSTIEEYGYEVQIRELRKVDDYEGKCTIYIWAPEGREFDEVPEQFNEDLICWESTMFSTSDPRICFEPYNSYLMHDGACCCLIGTVAHP